tara:strand:- start:30236 stop:30934 length:699 start_codon:yes stop_codon:yes gene_type:complete
LDLTSVYRDKSSSLTSKVTLALLHLAIVVGVLWILFGNGSSIIDRMIGIEQQTGSTVRKSVLAMASVLYFLRSFPTLFVFMKRRMPWSEVATVAVWVGIFNFLFAYIGSRSEIQFGVAGILGSVLLVSGSVIHTGSEWQRHVWKQKPENKRHLFTGGLWNFSRHINYFGDIVLFTGWALLTGYLALLTIPLLMLCGFVFLNIPGQDQYLAERYGEEYRSYANDTARLIPFIY